MEKSQNEKTFETLKAKKKRKTIRRNFFYAVLLLVVLVIFIGICFTFFFRIQKIVITGDFPYAPEEIEKNCGIQKEQNLYSFKKSSIQSVLTRRYPYIKNVEIHRQAPYTVLLQLEEDTASYLVEIEKEYFVLSSNLRVLERTKKKADWQNRDVSLKVLQLPPIEKAIVGKELDFWNDSDRIYSKNFLAELEHSAVYSQINSVRLVNKFDISLVYDNRFKVCVGDSVDANLKLEMLKKIVDDPAFQGMRGTIDVQDVDNESSLTLDNMVELG